MHKLVSLTEYFVMKDFAALAEYLACLIKKEVRGHGLISDLQEWISYYKQRVFPKQKTDITESAPDWDTEIGGLIKVKEKVEEIFGLSQKYSVFFKGQRVSQGLMLYGPPGCGKTYMAAAIAKKFNLNFISVKGPELLNKYIGASEQNVRELFEKAMAMKPAILFFDEFDSLVPKRGSGQSGVTDRIVNQFLCYLDGVEDRDGVFVMAATSRPDLVDVALLRPGRIDKAILCNFPDEDERLEILKVYLNKFNFKSEHSDPADHQDFLLNIVKKTANFTSADMKGLIQNCTLDKMSSVIKAESQKPLGSQQDDQEPDLSIRESEVLETFSKFVKGMNKQEMDRYDAIYYKFQDRGGSSSQKEIKN
jgi:peroxin-1